MRRMSKVLGDGQKYTFQTLSRLDLSNYQTLFSDSSARKMQTYQKRLDDGGELTEEEYDEFLNLQNERMKKVNDLIRISLSVNHPEFKLSNNPDQESGLNTKLEGILDVRDTGQIVEFITTGTITQVKETFIKEEDIVL